MNYLDHEPKIRAFIATRTEQEGECLIWTGAVDSHGTPVLRVAPDRRMHSVRRVMAALAGMDIEGKLVTTKCDCQNCIAHLAVLTRKKLQQRTAQRNPYAKSITRNKKISDKARERLAKLTLQQVREMRASGLASRPAAERYGIAQSTASDILSHRTWREYSSPWAGL